MNHEQRERLAFQQRVIDKEIRYLDYSLQQVRNSP